MTKDLSVIDNNLIKNKIILIRDMPVILDRDVAEIYGVETKDLMRAIKNNPDKFPDGYVFEIDNTTKNELVKNFHRFASLKHSSVLPKVFTEKGFYMLATILKSKEATKTTIQIVETFAQIRKMANNLIKSVDIGDEKEKKGFLKKGGG
jgi:phage regulator Rha-like protein